MESHSALSEEEFHRLQLQLIELRTDNYQLTDKSKKQENDLNQLNTQLAALDKDYQRATKAVNKSKKAKEFDLLIQENESLQRKLHSQEEEFRLQNSTLMQELGSLIAKNEELESTLNDQDTVDSPVKSQQTAPDASELNEEVIRLRAENTALQTNVGEIKRKFDNELKLLRSAVEGVDITESGPSSNDKSDTVSLTNLIQESELLSQLNDLKLSLDTEKAENKLLHDKVTELKNSSSADAAEQLRDKLKKKQESYIALQNEKEALYADTSSKITFLEESRQRDIKNFHAQIEKLKEELRTSKEERSNAQQLHEQQVRNLESNIETLKSKVDETNAKNLEQALQDAQRLSNESETLNQKLSSLQTELAEAKNELSQKDSTSANQLHRISELEDQLENTKQKLLEKSQAAEKRKKLLDELAIKSQEDSDSYKTKLTQLDTSYKQELDTLRSKHKAEISDLSRLLDIEKLKASQLETLKSEYEALTERHKSLEEAKSWLQRSLQDSEAKLKEDAESHEKELEELQTSNSQSLSNLQSQHEQSVKSLETQLSQKVEELEKLNSEKEALNQKVTDNVQDMKLHEKKGASLMKDLKRQLAHERKRGDRLEQRIQELTSSESKYRQPTAEPFFLPIDAERSSVRADDASSVSSWSGANYNHLGNTSNTSIRESSISSLREQTTPPLSNHEHDVPSLLILVESLQKEKSSLSERVSMLEQGNSAMADDLLKKQSIIEYYTMEGKEYVNSPKRSEKMTLKRVVDFVKDKGDESMNEKYRKCQRMLEETLTKNMCLQNDLEQLSKQLSDVKMEQKDS